MLIFAACPQCGVDLPEDSSACACGWRRRPAAKSHHKLVPCAHEGCPTEALIRIQTPTGWANLCRVHYEQHWSTQALAWCVKMHLTDRQAQREYCLQHFPPLRKLPKLADT
jgi:hypothetical protein